MPTPRVISEAAEVNQRTDSSKMELDLDDVVENISDESQILTDQDQTMSADPSRLDENMGAISNSLEPMEDEAPDFMRGEVDVKKQMDLTRRAMEDGLNGVRPDPPPTIGEDGELDAAFRETPGGLEEVIMKTEQERARKTLKNLH